MKATKQYFLVVLFIALYKVVLIFGVSEWSLLKCKHSIYPLRLVIHVVQERPSGEHGTQWDRNKKKSSHHLKCWLPLFVSSSPAWPFCTWWLTSCKGPVESHWSLFFSGAVYYAVMSFIYVTSVLRYISELKFWNDSFRLTTLRYQFTQYSIHKENGQVYSPELPYPWKPLLLLSNWSTADEARDPSQVALRAECFFFGASS